MRDCPSAQFIQLARSSMAQRQNRFISDFELLKHAVCDIFFEPLKLIFKKRGKFTN